MKVIIVQNLDIKNQNKIITEKQLIVIHWTACSGKGAVNWFTNSTNKRTSSHYVITGKGKIYQLVDEKYVAWHAGKSKLKDYPTEMGKYIKGTLNGCAIGIEIAGPPGTMEWDCWPEPEIKALIELCKEINKRWPEIKLTDHSTIAPGRKYDVKKGKGINLFPWERLLKETGIKEA